jgi:hypothetical protein
VGESGRWGVEEEGLVGRTILWWCSLKLLGLDMGNFVVYNVSLVHLHNGETCSPMVKRKREESEFV